MRCGDYLTYREVEAWMRCTGRKLNHWEVAAVMDLDRAYWAIANRRE